MVQVSLIWLLFMCVYILNGESSLTCLLPPPDISSKLLSFKPRHMSLTCSSSFLPPQALPEDPGEYLETSPLRWDESSNSVLLPDCLLHALCLSLDGLRDILYKTLLKGIDIFLHKTDRNLQSQAQIIYNSKLDEHNHIGFLLSCVTHFSPLLRSYNPDIRPQINTPPRSLFLALFWRNPNWDKYLFIHLFIFVIATSFIPLYFEIIPSFRKKLY